MYRIKKEEERIEKIGFSCDLPVKLRKFLDYMRNSFTGNCLVGLLIYLLTTEMLKYMRECVPVTERTESFHFHVPHPRRM